MKMNLLLSLILLAIITPTQVLAVYIVDTGEPINSTYNWSLINNVNGGEHYHAVQFELDQSYILNDMQGFFDFKKPGFLTMAIYGDSNNLPDASEELFAGTFLSTISAEPEWLGLSGLNVALQPGKYWLGFEPRSEDFIGFYAVMPDNAPQPLSGTAIYDSLWGSYTYSTVNHTVGVRINATLVPLPATIYLFGAGLLALLLNIRMLANKTHQI